MKRIILSIVFFAIFGLCSVFAKTRFKALVLYENGGNHTSFTKEARLWIDSLARIKHFDADYVLNTNEFSPNFLSAYQLIIQLDFPPYGWQPGAMEAFRDYIEHGRGGWIGLHHATLLGDFDGYKMWPWFSTFMGGIVFKSYIPGFASGEVLVETINHPLFNGLPKHFKIQKEEWYTYDKSPRPNVKVLASVDEKSYMPIDVPKMGDHPVIWTNRKVGSRNVYIFMGHGPDLFSNIFYTRLFENAIDWTVKPYLKH